jgi:hypothetical protein
MPLLTDALLSLTEPVLSDITIALLTEDPVSLLIDALQSLLVGVTSPLLTETTGPLQSDLIVPLLIALLGGELPTTGTDSSQLSVNIDPLATPVSMDGIILVSCPTGWLADLLFSTAVLGILSAVIALLTAASTCWPGLSCGGSRAAVSWLAYFVTSG